MNMVIFGRTHLIICAIWGDFKNLRCLIGWKHLTLNHFCCVWYNCRLVFLVCFDYFGQGLVDSSKPLIIPLIYKALLIWVVFFGCKWTTIVVSMSWNRFKWLWIFTIPYFPKISWPVILPKITSDKAIFIVGYHVMKSLFLDSIWCVHKNLKEEHNLRF